MSSEKQKVINQHYIPRMLLKNFHYQKVKQKNGKMKYKIYLFDKLKLQNEPRNIKSVAQEKYFYNYIDPNKSQETEKLLEKYETTCSREIKNIICSKNISRLNENEDMKKKMIIFFIMMYIRPKGKRIEILNQYNQFALLFHFSQDILHSVLLRHNDLKMEESFPEINNILGPLILKILPQVEKRILLLRLIYRRYCQIILKNHPILFYYQENENWSNLLSNNHNIAKIFQYIESYSSDEGYCSLIEEYYFNLCKYIKSTIPKKFKSERLYGLKFNGKKAILKLKKANIKAPDNFHNEGLQVFHNMLIKHSLTFCKILENWDFNLIKVKMTELESLIIGDNPVIPWGTHYYRMDFEISSNLILPISPDLLLELKSPESASISASIPNLIEFINQHEIEFSQRYIFSNEEDLQNLIHKYYSDTQLQQMKPKKPKHPVISINLTEKSGKLPPFKFGL